MHKNFFQTSDFFLYINIIIFTLLEILIPTKIPIYFNVFFGFIILIMAWFMLYLSKREFVKYAQKSGPGNDIKELINTGIYGYSRHPIYLAVLIINIGLSFILNSLWLLFGTIFLAFMLNKFLINKEELFLLGKFGYKYSDYKRKVRKFI